MADRSVIDEIKNRINIVDIAREYLPELKKRGKNYFSLCPFHSEKNPSFSVNEDLQIYKCFGCGAAGDVFSLIEKIEHLTFPEAVEKLAEKAGVDIGKFDFDPEYKRKKEIALKIHKLATNAYNAILTKHKVGAKGRAYLRKRKVSENSVKKFQLGWAPGNNIITKWFLKKGFKKEDLFEAGISIFKNDEPIDKFRNRLIFPIFDEKGNPIAFIGRVVEEDSPPRPKYLNTPETVIYQKGKTVYGLNFAKKEIENEGFVIVTEGTMNVISAYEIGTENVVAILGTGFTQPHAKLLKRYCKKIYFAFDNDDAGRAALLRAAPIALREEFEIKVIDIPIGKDIDECIKADPKSWLASVTSAKELPEWTIEFFKKLNDIKTISGKSSFIRRLKPFVDAIKDPVTRELWIKRIANEIGVRPETVESSIKTKEQEYDQTDQINPLAKLATESIERYLLGLAIQYWSELGDTIASSDKVYFSNSSHGKALKTLTEASTNKAIKLQDIINRMREDEKRACEDVAVTQIGIEESRVEETWKSLITRLRNKRIDEAIYTLKNKVREAENQGNSTKAKEFLLQIQKLYTQKSRKLV